MGILERMPPLYEIWRVKKANETSITPTFIVLCQELERFNNLIDKMRATLTLLRKALAGEIGMDTVLDNVAYSLFNGQLPASWRKLCPATCKNLGGWIAHFHRRKSQYNEWVMFFCLYYRRRFFPNKIFYYFKISPFFTDFTIRASGNMDIWITYT